MQEVAVLHINRTEDQLGNVACLQVQVVVVTQTVSVLHDGRTSSMAMAAALSDKDCKFVTRSQLDCPLPQVEVAVVTQTVSVLHDGRTSGAALAAALNTARLDASLTPPRQQAKTKGAWVPPAHLLAATALLAISCIQYLDNPTGAKFCTTTRRRNFGLDKICVWVDFASAGGRGAAGDLLHLVS